MADVQFEGEDSKSVLYRRFEAQSRAPKMAGWLLKFGIVKTLGQANLTLIVVALIAAGLAVYFFASTLRGSSGAVSPVGSFPPAVNEGIPR